MSNNRIFHYDLENLVVLTNIVLRKNKDMLLHSLLVSFILSMAPFAEAGSRVIDLFMPEVKPSSVSKRQGVLLAK